MTLGDVTLVFQYLNLSGNRKVSLQIHDRLDKLEQHGCACH